MAVVPRCLCGLGWACAVGEFVNANNTHLSLFSGIGGLDLAAEWAGFRTVAFVERDKYCQRVLAKHWPGIPIFSDVAEVTQDALPIGRVELAPKEPIQNGQLWDSGAGSGERVYRPALISGGFPCQPHSTAGRRKASADERDLWGECARIVGEFCPRWCVFENVPGLLSSEDGRFFGGVLGDLVSMGYRVGWGVWGADDVGAIHQRDRVFIVAFSELDGREGSREPVEPIRTASSPDGETDHVEPDCFDRARRNESGMGGEADGVSGWLDRSWEHGIPRKARGVPNNEQRLRALGNAVVPQQAYPIFKAIAELEGIGKGTE